MRHSYGFVAAFIIFSCWSFPCAFQARKGQRRKSGTGCVMQINDRLWEGRCSPIWPDGKRYTRNVYAHSEAECETLLAEMIVEMKSEIAAEKERLKLNTMAHRDDKPRWAIFLSVAGYVVKL